MPQPNKPPRARWFTTKVPSQIDKGDRILFNSANGKGPAVESPVTEQPKKLPDGQWFIVTELFPKGCHCAANMRVPIRREDVPRPDSNQPSERPD